MAGRDIRVGVLIEAEDKATATLLRVKKSARDLERGLGDIADSSGRAERGFKGFISQVAIGNTIANFATDAFRSIGRGLKDFIVDSVKAANNVERLMASINILGKNTGRTEEEIQELINAIREENKSVEEAVTITQGIILANLSQVDALNLLTKARNIGATVGKSSAEVNQIILASFQQLNPQMLKQVGINFGLTQAYQTFAAQTGAVATELTTVQKQMAIFNETMRQGEFFNGAYNAAMETTQKLSGSVKDAFRDVNTAAGFLITDSFPQLTRRALDAVRAFREWAFTADNEFNPQIKAVASAIGDFLLKSVDKIIEVFTFMFEKTKQVILIFQQLRENISAMLSPNSEFVNSLIVIRDNLRLLWETIVIAVSPAFESLFKTITERLMPSFKRFIEALKPLAPFGRALAQVFGTLLLGAFITVINIIVMVIDVLARLMAIQVDVSTALVNVFAKGLDVVTDSLATMFGWINDIIEGIGKMIRKFNEFKNSGFSLNPFKENFKIPFLAEGGIVRSPTLAVIGESGPEAVVPLSKLGAVGGGNAVTVNINGGTFLSEDAALAIGDMVIEKLRMQIAV